VNGTECQPDGTFKGIICPKNLKGLSKVLITLLLIILSPILIIPVLLYFLWGVILYLAIWLTSKKQFVVFVYSNSPTWKDYIEREILPHIQDRAVILNWSERRNWKNSLAVLAFQYFGGYRNFNPIGMIFRPLRFVKTYRFFVAFKEFKHGDPRNVEKLRKNLFDDIEI
jgi:hypothetical protein